MKRYHPFTLFVTLLLAMRAHAGGTWVPLANNPPVPVGHFLLLSDGSVMGENLSTNDGPGWYRLTPDIHGSYVNGTWAPTAPMSYTRLDFSSDVLPDGRLFVAGGEYGSGSNTAEIYNPVSNSWTTIPIPAGILSGSGFVDSDSVLLSNGKVLVTPVFPATNGETVAYDPVANTWSTALLKNRNNEDESGSVKLPDDSILMVDTGSTTSERYIPSLNQWVNDAIVPVPLYDTFGTEEGPGMLLPNGKAIFFGGTSNTAIYTPSGTTSAGSWAAGPPIPNAQGMPDSPAAMLVNGKVLCVVEQVATNKTEWYPPLSYYEYDYVANSFTQVSAPRGGSNFNDVCWPSLLAELPDGSVLYGHRQKDFYIYQPDGVPLAAGKPAISSITVNGNGSLHLTGTLFNGLCQGASYGDDEQMDSNFPIVRFTDASGNVRYGRTYNWSNTGVMKGSLVVSTDCAIPPGASISDNIQVIANGIASGYNPIVENANDSGPGSLRDLVNTLPAGYTITFAAYLSGQTIHLTSTHLVLANNLNIDASALPGGIAIDGSGSNEVFYIDGGVTANFKSLTITNGAAGSGFGGGIANYGTISLTGCTLAGNSASQGGAIENSGLCHMTNCTMSLNTCTGNGAAVDDNQGNGSLTLVHCTVFGNSAGSGGGGVANYLQ
ncbi:MAG TPA: kelch repeat-containing protein, partial [Verrucomicrobiae bacterium]|nr:kelch repeat-containing protein [Verrucomicrobiae bacterium]